MSIANERPLTRGQAALMKSLYAAFEQHADKEWVTWDMIELVHKKPVSLKMLDHVLAHNTFKYRTFRWFMNAGLSVRNPLFIRPSDAIKVAAEAMEAETARGGDVEVVD